MSRFVRDTSVERIGSSLYRARMDRAWWIVRGPNGGYVAATLLRALEAEIGDPGRPPRSMTVHYLRPPEEGEVEITVTIERAGRSVTTLSARMLQGGKVVALALAAFASPRRGRTFDDLVIPVVPSPDQLPDRPRPPVPFHAQFVQRWAIGTPPVEGVPTPNTSVGGWIRLVEPEPVDHAVVAALTDAWPPAVFSRLGGPDPVPTVDLTIHFREAPPRREEWCLVRFQARKSHEGFVEEDGEVWSADGRLLAQSRQLAVILTPEGS